MVGGQPDSGVVAFDPAGAATPGNRWAEELGVLMTDGPGEPPVRWGTVETGHYSSPWRHGSGKGDWSFARCDRGLVALDPDGWGGPVLRWFRARVEESVNGRIQWSGAG